MRRLFPWLTGLALLTIVFPWTFSCRTTIGNFSVSLRALGDAWGVLFILIGAAVLFRRPTQDWIRSLAAELDSLSPQGRWRLIGAATALYAVGVISHKLRAQATLSTHALDLGFFSSICWNTAHENFFMCSILERNFMAVHVNWILWPLSLFYRWGGDARVLLIAQAFFVAAALPFVWLTAQRITGSFAAGVLSAILYLSSHFINHMVSNDFHPDSWQLPCLMAALWAWQCRWNGVMIVLALLALLAKEDVAFVVAGFALILLKDKKTRAAGLLLFAAAIGWFLYQTQIYTPRFLGDGQRSILLDRYPFLGRSFGEMARNFFVRPSVYVKAFFYDPLKFVRLLKILFPVMGLPVLCPVLLIPPIISLLPHLLSQASTQLSLTDIYIIPSQPFLYLGAAMGAMKFLASKRGAGREVMLAGLALLVAGLGILDSPRYFRNPPPERLKAFAEMKKLVPKDASLCAQQELFPHFDTRRTVQLFPIDRGMGGLQVRYIVNPEYIVGDRTGNALPYDGETLKSAIAALEKDRRYEKIFDREGFFLFRRVAVEEMRFVNMSDKIYVQQTHP